MARLRLVFLSLVFSSLALLSNLVLLSTYAQTPPRASDVDPNREGETFIIAVQLQLDGNHAEAARLYETLLAASNDDVSVYYNLGVAYAYAGDLPSALNATLQAAQLDPRAADIRSNLRIISQEVGVNPPLILPLTQRELLNAALIFWTLLSVLLALRFIQGRARPLLVVPSSLGLLVCLAGFVWQVSQYGVML